MRKNTEGQKKTGNAIAMQICYNSPPLSIVGSGRVFLDRAFSTALFDTRY
jgi:hypothetical protein